MIISIDQSKRSTAQVVLDAAGNMPHFEVICPPKRVDEEELLTYQMRYLGITASLVKPNGYVIERPAYGAKGSSKDILAALFWMMRCFALEKTGKPASIIPVTSWRSWVLSKEEQREAKKDKDGLKKAVVAKLPENVWRQFDEYLYKNEAYIRAAKGSQWKDSMYDLADAWHQGQYRLSLNEKEV